ncbi:MAG: hypothetical protein ABSA81_09195 [Candidatus Bathyarchaeia archaeon]
MSEGYTHLGCEMSLKCPQCGTSTEPANESCKKCGRPFSFKATIESPRKRVTETNNRKRGIIMTAGLAAATVAVALWFDPSVGAYSLGFACLALVLWHFISPMMASLMIHGIGKSRFHPDLGKYTLLGTGSTQRPFTERQIIARSIFPLLFFFGFSNIALQVLHYAAEVSRPLADSLVKLGILGGHPGDPALELAYNIIWTSIWLLPFSAFVVPVKFIVEGLELRFFDRSKFILEDFRWSPFLANLWGLGAFYSLLVRLFTAGGAFTSALLGLATLLLFLLPASLLLSVLYHRFSLPRNIRRVQHTFREKGAVPFIGLHLKISGET